MALPWARSSQLTPGMVLLQLSPTSPHYVYQSEAGGIPQRHRQGPPVYLFFRAFRLANPYIRRGSLRNASIKSGPLTRPICHAFLMIWMTCGRS